MGRIIFELAGFFLLPFLAYAAFLIWRERHPRAARRVFSPRALQIQAVIGLALAIGMMLVFGLSADKRTGGYSPAVLRDGKLIEGKIN